MAYFSQSDIEEYTGFASLDFKYAGSVMTATQWATLCTHVVDYVTREINHFCNIDSYEPHTMTEYHDGRGAKGDEATYLEEDVRFYLREPCVSVGTVSEDIGANTGTIEWATRWQRSTATKGDYVVIKRNDLTWIRFIDNYPPEGYENVKIEYTAGYPEGSEELGEIRWLCLRIAKNFLLDIKKTQEVQTVRNTGIRDFSEMFRPGERNLITDDIYQDLIRHKRWKMGGPAWE